MGNNRLINRHEEIQHFQTFVSGVTRYRLLVFTGMPGLGKSFLLQHLAQMAAASHWTIPLDFFKTGFSLSFESVFEDLDHALKHSGLAADDWQAYTAEVRKIEQNFEDQRIIVNNTIAANNHSNISNVSQEVKVDVAEALIHLQSKAAIQKIKAWLDAARITGRRPIIFIDHWESLNEFARQELRHWVVEYFLLTAVSRLPELRVVIASQTPLREPALVQIANHLPLKPFGPDESQALLSAWGIEEPAIGTFLFDWTEGNPFLLCMAARLHIDHPDFDLETLDQGLSAQASVDWILGQFRRRMADERSQRSLEQAVVLEWFNRSLLSHVCQLDGADIGDWYTHFTSYPFIQDARRPGYKQFVRQVREINILNLWNQDQNVFQNLHSRARDWYTTRVETVTK
jgi:hypothetical protein